MIKKVFSVKKKLYLLSRNLALSTRQNVLRYSVKVLAARKMFQTRFLRFQGSQRINVLLISVVYEPLKAIVLNTLTQLTT